jgi:hypothetical protein
MQKQVNEVTEAAKADQRDQRRSEDYRPIRRRKTGSSAGPWIVLGLVVILLLLVGSLSFFAGKSIGYDKGLAAGKAQAKPETVTKEVTKTVTVMDEKTASELIKAQAKISELEGLLAKAKDGDKDTLLVLVKQYREENEDLKRKLKVCEEKGVAALPAPGVPMDPPAVMPALPPVVPPVVVAPPVGPFEVEVKLGLKGTPVLSYAGNRATWDGFVIENGTNSAFRVVAGGGGKPGRLFVQVPNKNQKSTIGVDTRIKLEAFNGLKPYAVTNAVATPLQLNNYEVSYKDLGVTELKGSYNLGEGVLKTPEKK